MKKFDYVLSRFEEVVTVACFSLMSIITLVAVFSRAVLESPIIWSEEVARYLMVWGIFIGISIVTRKRAQLGIDLLISFAPTKLHKKINFTTNAILVFTYITASILSIMFVIDAFELGNLTPITRIKFAYIYLAMPIGFILSTYRAIQNWIEDMKGDGIDENKEEVIL